MWVLTTCGLLIIAYTPLNCFAGTMALETVNGMIKGSEGRHTYLCMLFHVEKNPQAFRFTSATVRTGARRAQTILTLQALHGSVHHSLTRRVSSRTDIDDEKKKSVIDEPMMGSQLINQLSTLQCVKRLDDKAW